MTPSLRPPSALEPVVRALSVTSSAALAPVRGLRAVVALGRAALRPAGAAAVLRTAAAGDIAAGGREPAKAVGAPSVARIATWLVWRAASGVVGGLVVLGCGVLGAAYVVWPVVLAALGDIDELPFVVSVGLGVAALVLGWQLSVGLASLDGTAARHLLGPDSRAALQRRVDELAGSRAAVLEAVDDERRRIERDLHDGVQQRVVALGMLLGRARRSDDPVVAQQLVAAAHEQASGVLADLREVVWRVYPAALDADGLVPSVRSLAERSALPVEVEAHLPAEPSGAVARAAYFVVSEALGNVQKHAGASRAHVLVGQEGDRLVVRVRDDGRGGADPTGPGLTGLARRVAGLDGTLVVRSPAGGPTEVEAVLPCGS